MTKHRDPYCTTTDCKCYLSGQQQEQSAIIHYIKTQRDLDNIIKNDKCRHGTYSWDGCTTCCQENLIKNLTKGAHHK